MAERKGVRIDGDTVYVSPRIFDKLSVLGVENYEPFGAAAVSKQADLLGLSDEQRKAVRYMGFNVVVDYSLADD